MLWPEGQRDRPVFTNRQVRLRVQQRGEVTPYGGLALAHDLVMRLELDKDLNRSLPLLKLHLPYHESDHLLTHNGIAALRMPTGELLANSAFPSPLRACLMAGQRAWCLRSWLSLLALPQPTTRWEWKWFRQAFGYVAARITRHARRAVVVLSDGHRFVEPLLVAAQRLHSFVFQ
jgi:hypothetical protein